ncbi:MAG: NAD-dependent epimerase/dehydratase family protein [Longimicrobiales bacterium]|nr:NAD-dependent epimerase/dehydratase family protein [Longimicrobiales bacterium]
MSPTRRDFLRTAGAVGAGLALGGSSGCSAASDDPDSASAAGGPEPLNILILGGTGFIGPHMVRYAVERGHQVSTFTRGRSDADLPESVEQLIGDRNDDHSALEGRSWDVVLDNNTQDYRWVQTSTELLADAVDHYVFVSSISAYDLEGFGWDNADRILREPAVDEDHPRVPRPEGWTMGDDAPYGLMKTLGEDIVHAAFPGRATVVRPGLIVGPGDPTDRFTYWPVRLDEGGEVLAPGNPEHTIQVIDQRDLTEWIVRLAESGTTGDFNATGPAERLAMDSFLEQVGAAARNPYELTWVDEDFLEAQGVAPWSDLPAWIPGDPLMFVDVRDAVAAGLTFRPLSLTARDTLEWDLSRPAEERTDRGFGMSREREREVLDAWHARG